jgi:hypothetical protein
MIPRQVIAKACGELHMPAKACSCNGRIGRKTSADDLQG